MKKALLLLVGLIMAVSWLLVACKSTPTNTTAKPATAKPAATGTASPANTPKPTATTTTSISPASSVDKYGGTWNEALTEAPSHPIGYAAEAAPDSFAVASPALETLVGTRLDGAIVPRLATAWKSSNDGLSVTLTLRKGVKFHDGSDFDADVCKWNLDLVLAAKQSGTETWKSIDKVDDYTIRINFSTASNINLVNLSGGVTEQISKVYVDKNGVDAARWHPVGTGPFIFQSYETGARITYIRNPAYWDTGKPYLDGIVMTVIQDTNVQKLAFQKGDINRLTVQFRDAVALQQAKYTMKTAPGGTFALIPDSAVPIQPWSNINVRLAASYALDRDSLAKTLGLGFPKAAYQIYPGYADTHINGLLPTAFNQSKAKDLLNQAGFPLGVKATIHSFSGAVPNDYTTAVAAQLRTVGFDITIDFTDSGAYDNLRYSGWNDGLLNNDFTSFTNHNQMFTFYFMDAQFPSLKRPLGWMESVNASLITPQVDPAKIQATLQLMCNDMTVIPYLEQTQIAFYKKGSYDPDADTFGLWPVFQDCYIEKSAR